MIRQILTGTLVCVLLCQCNTMQRDCEALKKREAQIAQEPKGDYFVGRRYYVPATRFWGYLRPPATSWREAKLVIMDESACRTPDRGLEPPAAGAVYGTDKNVEYIVKGKYTGEVALDPSTDQILPVFRATSYTVKDANPGFLFVPSEKYDEDTVSLRPSIMPRENQCASFTR